MHKTALFAAFAFAAAAAQAGDALEALLAKNPAVEAELAYAKGDGRHIVLPVCGENSGEVLPGWPEDSPQARAAMDKGRRPLTCADLGPDPQRRNLMRAAQYAEKYNRKLLELDAKRRR